MIDQLNDLNDLKKIHDILMGEYVSIINHVSKLHFLVLGEVDLLQVSIPVFRYFIKLFVESHIKGKLNQLEDTYVQFALTIPTGEPSASEYQNWLKQAEAETKKFANTLTSLGSFRGVFSVLWPLLVTILGAYKVLAEILPISIQPFLISWILPILLLVVLYVILVIYSSFTLKRKFFLESPGQIKSRTQEQRESKEDFEKTSKTNGNATKVYKEECVTRSKSKSSKNVYQIENRLFDELRKGKTLEFPIDMICFFLLAIMFAVLMMSTKEKEYIITLGPEYQLIASLLVAVLSILFGILLLISGFQREWR